MHAKPGQNQVKNSVFDLIRGPVVKKYVWPSRARLTKTFSLAPSTHEKVKNHTLPWVEMF